MLPELVLRSTVGPAASYFSLQFARAQLALHGNFTAGVYAAGTGARHQIKRGLLRQFDG